MDDANAKLAGGTQIQSGGRWQNGAEGGHTVGVNQCGGGEEGWKQRQADPTTNSYAPSAHRWVQIRGDPLGLQYVNTG